MRVLRGIVSKGVSEESKNTSLMARQNRLMLTVADHRALVGWRNGSVVFVSFCCCRCRLSAALDEDVSL